MNIKRIKTFLACCLVCYGFAAVLAACSDDKEGMGTPVITGVRTCYPDKADSLFTKASPGQTIAIIGENLASALKVYINDQETYLNPTMNTAHSIIVTVPTEANGFKLTAFNSDLKDEIRVETTHGTATYSFKITAPSPSISRIQAGYPRNTGDVINVYGTNLVDIEKVYFTDLTAERLDTTEWKEVGGTHVEVTNLETVVKDHHVNTLTNAYETTSQLRFQLPQLAYSEGALVLECAAGITYIPYSRLPGQPVIFSISSDMPQIGETLIITGREFVSVSGVSYGDVTLSDEEFTVSESEDSIFVSFETKPSRGSATTISVTTPGGTAVAERFYDYTTLLTTFDNGDATDNGWGPNAEFDDDGTDDGNLAHIYVASEGQQWWGTMVFFRKDWSGDSFALPSYEAIPASALTDEVYFAANVLSRSDYNNGSFWGYLRYWLPNKTESDADPVEGYNQYDNGFAWENYDEQIGMFERPVLADINDQAPVGRWYRHVLPLSKFGKYAGKIYADVVADGIHQFRIQSINQSTSRGKVDVYLDNIRIIYVPKK